MPHRESWLATGPLQPLFLFTAPSRRNYHLTRPPNYHPPNPAPHIPQILHLPSQPPPQNVLQSAAKQHVPRVAAAAVEHAHPRVGNEEEAATKAGGGARPHNCTSPPPHLPPAPNHSAQRLTPQQKDQEIIACLRELEGLSFSLEDLRKPTPPKVQHLYEYIVDTLMGMRRESVEALVRAAGAEQEFPQAQYDAALLMTFYRSLTQLMTECGVSDFTFNDLLKPDADRLRVNLSSVINFLRFRGERWDLVDKYFQKGEQTKKRIEELYFQNDDLAAKIEHLRDQRKREEPAIKEAQTKNKNLTLELRRLGKIQGDVINEYQVLKDEKQKLKDTLSDKQYNIEVLRRDCGKLQPYIVDSPEKLHQTINDLNNTLAAERAELDTTERQVRALNTSADSFAIVEQDVNSCIKLMEDCENELSKEEESIRKSNRHEEILHQKEAEVREHDRKEDRVKRLITNAKEKLEKARTQAAEKRASARKEMEKLAAEYETLSKERDATNKENDRTNLDIERKEKEVHITPPLHNISSVY